MVNDSLFRKMMETIASALTGKPKTTFVGRYATAQTNIAATGSEIELDNQDGTAGVFLIVNGYTIYFPAGVEKKYNVGAFTKFSTTLDSGYDAINVDKKYEVRGYDNN
jgi:hypothetical protein